MKYFNKKNFCPTDLLNFLIRYSQTSTFHRYGTKQNIHLFYAQDYSSFHWIIKIKFLKKYDFRFKCFDRFHRDWTQTELNPTGLNPWNWTHTELNPQEIKHALKKINGKSKNHDFFYNFWLTLNFFVYDPILTFRMSRWG